MAKNEQRIPPAFTRGMFLRSQLFGGATALTLFLLSAPLWVFYVVPIVMAPWIVWELLRLDRAEDGSKQTKEPEESRPRRTSRSVA
jgi:hypothetical protein